MQKPMVWGAAVLATVLVGCSGASFLLKSPIQDRCEESGLQGCADMTDGIIAYVDGDKAEARDKVLRAAAKNSPSELKKFAEAVKALESIPGASAHMGPIVEIADLLLIDAVRTEKAMTPSKGKVAKRDDDEEDAEPAVDLPRPSPPEGSKSAGTRPGRSVTEELDVHVAKPLRYVTADSDPSRTERGFAAPALVPDSFACGGGATCVRATSGVAYITDISVTEGCPAEMFVAAGAPTGALSSASWSVDARRGVHGARLLVKKDEALFLGVAVGRGGLDRRCAITWSGFRPYDVEASK